MTRLTYLIVLGGAVVSVRTTDASIGPPHSWNSTPETQQAIDGKKLFLKNCRQCHGATGEPNSENKAKYPKIKSLNDAKFLTSLPDDSILTVMKKGAGKDMKGFGDKLSDEEMRAVLQYVRTLPKG